MKGIDLHNHWLPKSYIDSALKGEYGDRVALKERHGMPALEFTCPRSRKTTWIPLMEKYYNWEERFKDMDAAGVDVAAVSQQPYTFHYTDDSGFACQVHQQLNDELAAVALRHPGRIKGLGNLPLQDVSRAVAELERVVRRLGLSGVQVGSNVCGSYLGEPDFIPFWEAASALGAVVLIHPTNVAAGERLTKYYLRNLIGNPLDTTITAASIIFGGILDRFPHLKICLSHAGGLAPFAIGRFNRGYAVRPECATIPEPPGTYLKKFYFDTITHHPRALEYLIAVAGAEQVVIGTDYPFDMGMETPVAHVDSISLDPGSRDKILSGNARRLLGL